MKLYNEAELCVFILFEFRLILLDHITYVHYTSMFWSRTLQVYYCVTMQFKEKLCICHALQQKLPYVSQACFEILSKITCNI